MIKVDIFKAKHLNTPPLFLYLLQFYIYTQNVQFYVFPEPFFGYGVSREFEVALIYLSDGRDLFFVLSVT